MDNRKHKRNNRAAHIIIVLLICCVLFMTVRYMTSKLHEQNKETSIKAEQVQESNDTTEEQDEGQTDVLDESVATGQLSQEGLVGTSGMTEEIIRKGVGIDTLKAGNIVNRTDLQENTDAFFKSYSISVGDAIFERINGKSYRENPDIALSDLRYLKMLHYNFNHEIQVGEMIVNKNVSEDVLHIFQALFDIGYEIESMRLIDDYWTGDGVSSDSESIRNNNTSAFCYRTITRGSSLSNHALGRAIDLNPKQNPYIWFDSTGQTHWGEEDAAMYLDRNSGIPHMILRDDPCYLLFKEHGFSWGGDWSNPIDYQHFEKYN